MATYAVNGDATSTRYTAKGVAFALEGVSDLNEPSKALAECADIVRKHYPSRPGQ